MRTIGVTWGELAGSRDATMRVYLAGPRTCLDPAGYAALTSALLELGLIDRPVEAAFAVAARDLRAVGADVTSPFEEAWWRGAEVGADELRAGRAAHATAPVRADLVAVLDGWLDVPGAVDVAVIAARTSGVPVVPVSEAIRALGAARRRPAA
jgi:hypothetical protein